MTFSIVARCVETGMFGVALSSSSPAVAARCAFARAGVGAVVSQNITDPRLGPATLAWMEQGFSAREAVKKTVESTESRDFRQLAAVDRNGIGFVYTGVRALGVSSDSTAPDVVAAGNLLASADIPDAMVEAFRYCKGHLADRLIEAMRIGLDAGGEEGPVHSAGLKVVEEVSWPIIDLRVDWTQDGPIDRLAEIWSIYRSQVDDYVTRALNPSEAPSYGVPGDEYSD